MICTVKYLIYWLTSFTLLQNNPSLSELYILILIYFWTFEGNDDFIWLDYTKIIIITKKLATCEQELTRISCNIWKIIQLHTKTLLYNINFQILSELKVSRITFHIAFDIKPLAYFVENHDEYLRVHWFGLSFKFPASR